MAPPLLALASIAFNKPRLIEEQIRLLKKYLQDDFELHVFDASSDEAAAEKIRAITIETLNFVYWRLGNIRQHDEALNFAAEQFDATMIVSNSDAPYIGFLDHDIFPTQPTTLIDKIEEAGFYGVGQRHAPTGHLYLWPGFCFFSREWLAGRTLDFRGIRAENPADNGDTGSGMWPLFENEDWSKLYRVDHGYRAIREPDEYGLQSWGVETISDWLHVSNGSHWMNVPNPDERDRLVYDMIAAL